MYNAGHWNDLGAFYGVNNIAKDISKDNPDVHTNRLDEYDIKMEHITSLQVSEFPTDEYIPMFTLKKKLIDKTNEYKNVKRNDNYRKFTYVENDSVKTGPKKMLCFQRSYMDGMGYKFMENLTREYINVHAYQNIMNLDYYFQYIPA